MADGPLGRSLDLRGLRCPLPVLRLEAAIRRAPAGTTFRVTSDDPVALVDIPHAMREGGHVCERVARKADECVFKITSKR